MLCSLLVHLRSSQYYQKIVTHLQSTPCHSLEVWYCASMSACNVSSVVWPGSNNGELKMWNFNSGSQLRQYEHREEHVEYTAVLFVHDADRQSNQVVIILTELHIQPEGFRNV